MSWNLDWTGTGGGAESGLLSALVEAPNAPKNFNPDGEDAANAAVLAVVALINSGGLGRKGDTYHVVLSGHGNPKQRPQGGYSNDFVNISIQQMTPA